jgi:hypothetical protein
MEYLTYADDLDEQIEVLNDRYTSPSRVLDVESTYELSNYVLIRVDNVIEVRSVVDFILKYSETSEHFVNMDRLAIFAVNDILIWTDDITTRLIQVFDDKIVHHEVYGLRKGMSIARHCGNGRFVINECTPCNMPSRAYVAMLTKATIRGTETHDTSNSEVCVVDPTTAKTVFGFTNIIQIQHQAAQHYMLSPGLSITNITTGELILYYLDGEFRINKNNGYLNMLVDSLTDVFTEFPRMINTLPMITLQEWSSHRLVSLYSLKSFKANLNRFYENLRSWFNGTETISVCISKSASGLSKATIINKNEVADNLRNAVLQIDVKELTITIGSNLLHGLYIFNDTYAISYDFDSLAIREIKDGKGKHIKFFPCSFRLKYLAGNNGVVYYLMNRLTEDNKSVFVRLNFP